MKVKLTQSAPIADYVPGLGTVTLMWQGVDEVTLHIEDKPKAPLLDIRECLEHYVVQQELTLKRMRHELGYFKEVLAALPRGG